MEDPRKRKYHMFHKLNTLPGIPRLWCGRIQGLCDGTICSGPCHMFPDKENESHSIIAAPTLCDHGSIGLTSDGEEE